MPYADPEARRAYKQKWYQEHRQETIDRVTAWARTDKGKEASKLRDRKRRGRLDDYKRDKPCSDCGRTFPPYCMDFDHLGDKEFNVSHLTRHSWSTVEREIAKCELVCANCHRIRTVTRLNA